MVARESGEFRDQLSHCQLVRTALCRVQEEFHFTSVNVPLGTKILYPLASVTMLQCSYLSESLSDMEMSNMNVLAVVF
jgi:hypothetical protein